MTTPSPITTVRDICTKHLEASWLSCPGAVVSLDAILTDCNWAEVLANSTVTCHYPLYNHLLDDPILMKGPLFLATFVENVASDTHKERFDVRDACVCTMSDNVKFCFLLRMTRNQSVWSTHYVCLAITRIPVPRSELVQMCATCTLQHIDPL